MIGFLQRVNNATVEVDHKNIARIGRGLLVLVAVEHDDRKAEVERLLERVMGYRVFSDNTGRMNLSIQDIEGDLLLVPQFTLAADTGKGMRPSFTPAAAPERASLLFDYLVDCSRSRYARVAQGQFGTDMQVSLTNDGPVSFLLKIRRQS